MKTSKLKELRRKYNYTCDDMAKMLHISKPYYWQLENKKRRLFYDTATRIALIFDLKPDDIFYEEFKKDIKKPPLLY